MPRLKITPRIGDKNNEPDTYVPADELSVEEATDITEEEKTMQVKENGIATGRRRRKAKGKSKGQEKTERKVNLRAGWDKAMTKTNEKLTEVLDDEDVVEVGHRFNVIARAGKRCIGQRLLDAAKDTPVVGEVLAASEIRGHVNHTIDNVKDIITLGKKAGQLAGNLVSGFGS